jgi:uncharacterized membrane-anchored protein YitT (DUF2179 family)
MRKKIQQGLQGKDEISDFRLAKKFYQFKISIRQRVIDFILIALGVLSAGFGLRGFLLPNDFIDGGATGISLLLAELTPVSLSVLLIIVNSPFILFGYRTFGAQFIVKTALAVGALALCVALVPYPDITHDKLLVAVFGGFFLGAGIGLSVRGGAVIDGTEVMAIYFSRKTGLSIGDIILIFNILIFMAAAYLLSVETALYSILTYLAASKTVDFIIEGIEEYTGVTIISNKSEEIRDLIINTMGRGVTIFNGKRGFGKQGENPNEIDIIFTVITRLEVTKLQEEIEKTDSNAFIIMHSIKDTRGGMIKKRPLITKK